MKIMDPWWGYYVINPPAFWATWFLANFTKITPNNITFIGFLMGVIAAACFYIGDYIYLVLGALFYQMAMLCDSVDGKLARVRGTDSKLGEFFDTIVNHLYYLMSIFAFAVGNLSSDIVVLWSAALLLFLRAMQVVLNAYDTNNKDVTNIHTPIHPSANSWLARHGLLYPMSTPDREVVLFFIGPIAGLVGPFLLFGVLMDAALAMLKVKRILNKFGR